VHQDDLARRETGEHASHDRDDRLAAGGSLPPERVLGPTAAVVAERVDEPQRPRVTLAERETEERSRIAPRPRQDPGSREAHLAPDGRVRELRQAGMVEGVVADGVVRADRSGVGGVAVDPAAGEGERRQRAARRRAARVLGASVAFAPASKVRATSRAPVGTRVHSRPRSEAGSGGLGGRRRRGRRSRSRRSRPEAARTTARVRSARRPPAGTRPAPHSSGARSPGAQRPQAAPRRRPSARAP
jgi:hypothetical protein